MKMFALFVMLTGVSTGEVEIKPMEMAFIHPASCQDAADYFNGGAYTWPRQAEITEQFYYCKIQWEGSSP